MVDRASIFSHKETVADLRLGNNNKDTHKCSRQGASGEYCVRTAFLLPTFLRTPFSLLFPLKLLYTVTEKILLQEDRNVCVIYQHIHYLNTEIY